MRKIYTITLITFLVLLVSVRGFVSYYHISVGSVFDISHVYADDGGDGGGDGGDGEDGDDGSDDDSGDNDDGDNNGGGGGVGGSSVPVSSCNNPTQLDLSITMGGVEQMYQINNWRLLIDNIQVCKFNNNGTSDSGSMGSECGFGGTLYAPIWSGIVSNVPHTYEFMVQGAYDEEDNVNQWSAFSSGSTGTLNCGIPSIYTLSVNSVGSSGVDITSATGHGGTTDYSKPGIVSGTDVILTAPLTASGNNFAGWSGCDSVSSTTCAISVTADRSAVVTFTSSTSGPTCPIEQKDGRILVDLDSNGYILSNQTEAMATKGPIPALIPAGVYDVTLVSYDDHINKPDQIQPNESWYLIVRDSSGALVINTNAIGDLPQDEDYKVEQVNTNLVLTQDAASITAFHAAFFDSNANSITPLCAAFDEVVTVLPTCPLPTITSELSSTITVNQPFSYVLTATTTGVVSTTTSFIVATSSLPDGLSYSTSTATISGIPTETGIFSVAVSVTNDCGIDESTLVIIVNSANGGGSFGANLAVVKIVDKPTAKVGDTVTYTITIVNNGPDNSTGVFLTDIIPNELDFVSATSTLGGYSTTTGIWTVGDLENSSSSILTLVSAIKAGNEGKTIVNIAVASSTQSDPNLDDNTSSVNIAVDDEDQVCTENCGNAGGGGGGGGSSSGSSGGGSSKPSASNVVGDTTCFYLRDYLRRDFDNDPIEVLKLQAFLRNFEGHDEVSLTGVFDQATFDAVSVFQMKYFSDILEPWGHTGPTGYVYILTLKKINEIYCQRIYPLNQAQVNEIIAFKALLESLRMQGIDVNLEPSSESGTVEEVDTSATTTPLIPVVGEEDVPQGQNLRNLAAAIFAMPNNLLDALKCSYEFLLVLVVLYILGNVLKDVLYKNKKNKEDARKRFIVKWFVIDVGLVLAIIAAYIMRQWCPILPLLIALIISLAWTLTYSKHNSFRASVKSWYLVGIARAKSVLKNVGGNSEKRESKEPEPVLILPKLIPKEREKIETVATESKE